MRAREAGNMSLGISKVRANIHDPFARRTRSPIYANHMARWEPEPGYRALLSAIGRVLWRRISSSRAASANNEGQLSELETIDVR
jgi:hypothetical protein